MLGDYMSGYSEYYQGDTPMPSLHYNTIRAAVLSLVMMFCLAMMFLGGATSGFAHDYKIGDLVLNHPWARATPPMAKVAGGYLSITNTGNETDILISGSTDIAGRVELHEMAVVDDIMRMRKLERGIIIPAGETVVLKPGGLHIMLMQLKDPLIEGERASTTLVFEKAGAITVDFAIEAMGAQSGGGMNMDQSGHNGHQQSGDTSHDHHDHKHH